VKVTHLAGRGELPGLRGVGGGGGVQQIGGLVPLTSKQQATSNKQASGDNKTRTIRTTSQTYILSHTQRDTETHTRRTNTPKKYSAFPAKQHHQAPHLTVENANGRNAHAVLHFRHHREVRQEAGDTHVLQPLSRRGREERGLRDEGGGAEGAAVLEEDAGTLGA
jgi:hypothetical protein